VDQVLKLLLIKVYVFLVHLGFIPAVKVDVNNVHPENIQVALDQLNVYLVAAVEKRIQQEMDAFFVQLEDTQLVKEIVNHARSMKSPLLLVLVNAQLVK